MILGNTFIGPSKAKALESIEDISELIKQQANQENNPTKVRSSALKLLAQQEDNSEHTPLFESAIQEKSLLMAASGLYGLSQVDYQKALFVAPSLEKELPYDVAKLYVEYGGVDKNIFFTDKLNTSNTLDLYYISAYYVQYLKNQELSLVLDGTEALVESLKDSKSWMVEVSKYRFADLEETIQIMLKNEKNKELKLRAKETLVRIESLL